MKSLYYPYKATEDRPDLLVLKLGTMHKFLHFYMYRILPMLIMGFALLFFSVGPRNAPWWVSAYILLLVLLSFYLLSLRTNLDVTISKSEVYITRFRFFSTRMEMFLISEAACIEQVIERQSRGSHIRFSLVMKDGEKHVFARFPFLGEPKKEKLLFLRQQFETRTGLKIAGQLP